MVGYSGTGYANPGAYFTGSYLDPTYAENEYWDGRDSSGPGGSQTAKGTSAPSAVTASGEEIPIRDLRGGADFSGAHQSGPIEAPSIDNNYGFAAVPDAVRAFGIVPGARALTTAVTGGFAVNNAAAINNARAALGLSPNSVLGGMYNANVGIVGTVNIGDQTYTVAMDPNPEDPNQISVNDALTISAETLNDITEATPEQVEARETQMKEAGTTPSAGGIKSAIGNIAGTVTGGLVGTDPNKTTTQVDRSMPTPSVDAQNRALSTYNEQFDNPTQVASLDPTVGVDTSLNAGVNMAPDATEQGVNALGVADRGFISPMAGVTGRVTSEFGVRNAPNTTMGKGTTNHKGMDFSAAPGAMGQTVGSTMRGTVTSVDAEGLGKLGKNVSISHPDGTVSTYGHLQDVNVSVGDEVGTGAPIGSVGATGNVSGPHLHFGMKDALGQPVNPRDVISTFDPGIPTPMDKPTPTEQAISMQDNYTPGTAISPAGFSALGLGAQYTGPELQGMATTLAGELGPETLQGLVDGDETALAEAYGVLGTMDNRAMTNRAMNQVTTVGPMEGVLSPDQYNALTPENLDTTLDNYNQYKDVLDNVTENYAMGLGKTTTPGATHYANMGIVDPGWANTPEAQATATQVGQHTFSTPDQSWGQVQDAYGTAFGPAAAVGIGQENVTGLGAPDTIGARMDNNMLAGDVTGGLALGGGYLSGTNLDTGIADTSLGGLAMADTESSVATGDGTAAASAAAAADSTAEGSQGDSSSGDSEGGDSGGSSGSDGASGASASAGGTTSGAGERDNDRDGRGT